MAVNPNFTNANANTTYFAASGGGGGGSNFPNGLTIGTSGAGGNIFNTSTLNATLNTTTSNQTWIAQQYNFRPDLATKGGGVRSIWNWDAVNTGANNALTIGSDSIGAFVGAEWLGNIIMPIRMYGANISLISDNETFMFMDGKAGGLGSISTGTPFLSGSNLFSSITAPTATKTANMTALISTLAFTFPACFS